MSDRFEVRFAVHKPAKGQEETYIRLILNALMSFGSEPIEDTSVYLNKLIGQPTYFIEYDTDDADAAKIAVLEYYRQTGDIEAFWSIRQVVGGDMVLGFSELEDAEYDNIASAMHDGSTTPLQDKVVDTTSDVKNQLDPKFIDTLFNGLRSFASKQNITKQVARRNAAFYKLLEELADE